MISLSTTPAQQVRFSLKDTKGNASTYGIFSREGGQTLQLVQFKDAHSHEYTTLDKYNEQAMNLDDVAYEVAATLFEISDENDDETLDKDSDTTLEIARAMLAPFSLTFGR